MTPAQYAIDKFEGVRPLARAIKCSPSWVCRWRKSRAEGGTGGAIPAEQQTKILKAAKKKNIPIDAAALVMR